MYLSISVFLRIDLQLCCLADIGEFLAWSLHSVQCSLPLKGKETEHLRNSTGPIWHWPWTLEAALTWLHDISRRSLQEAKKARKDTFHLTSESSIPRKFPRFFPDQVAQVETGHVKERIAIGLCFWHPPSLVVCKQHWNYQMNFRWIGSIIPVRSIRSDQKDSEWEIFLDSSALVLQTIWCMFFWCSHRRHVLNLHTFTNDHASKLDTVITLKILQNWWTFSTM